MMKSIQENHLQHYLCCVRLAPELEHHTKHENEDTTVTTMETGVVISINQSHGSVANAARLILEEKCGNLFLPFVCNRMLTETRKTADTAIELVYGDGYKTVIQRDREKKVKSNVHPSKRIFVHLRIGEMGTDRSVSSLAVLPPENDLFEHLAAHAKENDERSDDVSSVLWLCTGDPLFRYIRNPNRESILGISVPSNVNGYWTGGFCDPSTRENLNGLLQSGITDDRKRSSKDAELDQESKQPQKKERKAVARKITKSNEMHKQGGDNERNEPPETPKLVANVANILSPMPVVHEKDRPYATRFIYSLFDQMRICHLVESDRVLRRVDNPLGMAGFACMHCFGEVKPKGGTGRYFPMARKRIADFNHSLRVCDHVIKCPRCPQEKKDELTQLRQKHSDEMAVLKSQTKFFESIFFRLRENDLSSDPIAAANQDKRAKVETSKKDTPKVNKTPKKDTPKANKTLKKDTPKESKTRKKATKVNSSTNDENSIVSKKVAEEMQENSGAELREICDEGETILEQTEGNNCEECTPFASFVLQRMRICNFQKEDVTGDRKKNGIVEGFAGLSCQYCANDSLSGRFFLPQVLCLEEDSIGISCFYSHLTQCERVPEDLKISLESLKLKHAKDQENVDPIAWKAFVGNLWKRLRKHDIKA